ncbi:MAG: DUF2795 domain-containing protein [Methanosarcina sp.]|jgi:hypothetical protein
MRTSMADVEHSLKGIDFPKNKSEIVKYAQDHGASQEIVTDLQEELQDRTYTNAADVAHEFSGKRLGGER